jgi:hypothetical protein
MGVPRKVTIDYDLGNDQLAARLNSTMSSESMAAPNALQLRPARLSDLSSIAGVWAAAFFDDEIIGEIMHPHRNKYPDDVCSFLLRGIRERFWDWRHQFMVVTNGGKVVGAADWRRLGKGGAKRELWKADPRESKSELFKLNKDRRPSLQFALRR